MADDFTTSLQVVQPQLREIFESGDYIKVFGFLQFVIRHPKCPYNFDNAIERALRFGRAAYRVIEKTIFPISSESEKQTIVQTFADLAKTEFHGAREHLRRAGQELAGGNNAASIRESIHSVESVIRTLEPKGDFAKALARLDSTVNIHGA
jgi:hypothetical protein